MARVPINGDDIEIPEVSILATEEGVLRLVLADVVADAGDSGEPLAIGSVRAYVAWREDAGALAFAGDAEGGDEELLASAAGAIMANRVRVRDALLVDQLWLDPAYRGNRLTGPIIRALMRLLGLHPSSTAVVLSPVPLDENRSPLPPGPASAVAARRLKAAYREAGFEPWPGNADVWWLTIAATGNAME